MGYLGKNTKPLKMRPPVDLRVFGCVDSDWASDKNDRKSIGGYLITIGNCLVDWQSKKQGTIALSSTEAEYMAYSDAGSSIKYLLMLITEVVGSCPRPAILYEDNTGAIHLVNNDHIGKRTKHIDIKYRFVNALVKEGQLKAEFIRSEDNAADIMTKHVVEKLFVKHATNIYEGKLFPDSVSLAPNKEDVKDKVLGAQLVPDQDVTNGRTKDKVESLSRMEGESSSNKPVGHTGYPHQMTGREECLALQPDTQDWLLVKRKKGKQYKQVPDHT